MNLKRKISSYVVCNSIQEMLFRLCKEMVHAHTEDIVQSCELRIGLLHLPLQEYLLINWIPQKEMRPLYLCRTTVTFGNTTNNHIECENRKIKHRLHSSSSMAECINNLVFHNDVLDREHMYATFLHHSSVRQFGELPADVQAMYAEFMVHAAKKMVKNRWHMDVVNIEQQDADIVTVSSGFKEYEVHVCDGQAICTCTFGLQLLLPCEHAVVVQRHLGLPLGRLAFGNRWRLSSAGVVMTEVEQHPIIAAQKYRRASCALQLLMTILTSCGTECFILMLAWLWTHIRMLK
uniref:uncharacterized protein n=1 Tax=Pristiophorus japonicus TaxID=55135 RepID=UPI00398F030E